MNFNDIKYILHKYSNCLMEIKTLNEITPLVDGLTDFDTQQILATTRNDGYRMGNKKLLLVLERKSGRSFCSFLIHLKCLKPALAESIIQFMNSNYRHMYKRYKQYENERDRPSAFVKPIVQSTSNQPEYLLQSNQNLQSTNREQEFSEPSIESSVETISRTPEVRRASFTEDSLLEDIPNVTYTRWAAELNRENRWKKIGDLFHLTRHCTIKISNTSDPGTAMLDFVCSVENITVKGFINLLESIQLTSLIDIVKESLGFPTAASGSRNELEEQLYERHNSDELFGDNTEDRAIFHNDSLVNFASGDQERNQYQTSKFNNPPRLLPEESTDKPSSNTRGNQSKERTEETFGKQYSCSNVSFGNNFDQPNEKCYFEKIINTPFSNEPPLTKQSTYISSDTVRRNINLSPEETAIAQPVSYCHARQCSRQQISPNTKQSTPSWSMGRPRQQNDNLHAFPASPSEQEHFIKQTDQEVDALSGHLKIDINLISFHDLQNSVPIQNTEMG